MTTLFDILREVKPKRALFTSYTYSSIWFEAGPYPFLRRNGCEQITVMLDAREARHSVDNSTSRFGGSRYRIVSTTPTGEGAGIFHPKIAYLESDKGDVFVVGSGNLTVRGQGRSLEVLDAVSATTDPLVFGQIADFLERLPDRLAMLQESDWDVLARFAKRARAQMAQYGQNANTPQSVWLVTTLRETAASQFTSLAREVLSSPRTLTVLSPFFDRDVRAVTRLRDTLKVNTVQYGLARTRDGLIAPFLEDIEVGNKPSIFVEPPGNTRPLHAKWFELTDENGDALVMTGSVNATQQSLWNLNNIEVSLVRHLPQTSVGAWRKATETPIYKPCEYPAPLAYPDEITTVARITRKNELEAQFSRSPGSRSVQLVLHAADRQFGLFQLTVDDKNLAKVPLGEKFVRDLPDAALWLNASGDGFEATTWVNVEPQLSTKPAQVDLFKSLGRVEDDNYDEEDAFLLLNAAHMLLTRRKLNSKGKTGQKIVETKNEGEESDALVTEAEWLAGQGTGTRQSATPSTESLRIFKAIGKLLEMSDAEIKNTLAAAEDDESTDNPDNGVESDQDPTGDEELGDNAEAGRAFSSDDRKIEHKRRQLQESVAQARQTLQLAIDKRLLEPMPDALAMLIVPQKIRNNLRDGMPSALRLVDVGQDKLEGPAPQRLTSYLTGLLPTLMSMKLGPAAVDNLLPMVASAAALIALCLTRRAVPASYDLLRSSLETLAGSTLTESDYQTFLEVEYREGRLPCLQLFGIEDLIGQATLIARASCVEDRINRVLELALVTQNDELDNNMKDLAYIVKALRHPTGAKWKLYSILVVDSIPRLLSCPQCYGPLDNEEFRKLKSIRMAVCTANCRRPLFLKMGSSATHIFHSEDKAFVRDYRVKSVKEGGSRKC